ncbi:MAG: hypothetical protein ACLSFZ_05735 [Frisingicoccus sp.]
MKQQKLQQLVRTLRLRKAVKEADGRPWKQRRRRKQPGRRHSNPW